MEFSLSDGYKTARIIREIDGVGLPRVRHNINNVILTCGRNLTAPLYKPSHDDERDDTNIVARDLLQLMQDFLPPPHAETKEMMMFAQ